MVEASRDGRRVHFTNSLYRSWDDVFYPDGISGWMAKADIADDGSISLDPASGRLRRRWPPRPPDSPAGWRLLLRLILLLMIRALFHGLAGEGAMDLTSALILAGLGAFHGLNPAMGWLFAVALGLQEHSRNGVLRALPPDRARPRGLGAGHARAGVGSEPGRAAQGHLVRRGGPGVRVRGLAPGTATPSPLGRHEGDEVATGRMVVPDGHRPRRRSDGAPGRPAQRA